MTDDYIDDIEIPVVYITDGWAVDDIETIDDCEDAHTLLISQCAAIEHRIDLLQLQRGKSSDIARAKAALKWKKLALALINAKKGKLSRIAQIERENSQDRLILSYIGTENPALIRDAARWAKDVTARRAANSD
jgi:hypothetical protein